MTTKLRLLVDECVPAPFTKEIQNCSGVLSVEVIDANHPLGNRKTLDDVLVQYANQGKRIIVTVEGRLNEKRFPICTHPGIIVVKGTKCHEIERAKLFTRFMRSGHRGKCRHAVTRLRLENSVRLEHTENGSAQQVKIEIPK